ncbi:MAG: thiol reductant ABC exporter subunit CydD [Candidatus Nanopelagicales bacterium]|nr:thiol reductant ABC exporter subunit CydD [Candidatus Nanopelagicales bacterium]MCF8538127.1 thiol reductant ABC exporter subunit CydD [Candidatus Nanopelagicales bacterium]MCF8542415.1 thiol reductant ABC exporter subunit CydD [Candidatus Nanopelagicales bacterium]MCF8558045.1 thiol reductant ABC exporter subunit CydD [Candidatus Nanopelagicales bacterium]
MRPLDPRLMRYARSTRGFIVIAVVLGIVTAVLVIIQARLLSDVIVRVTSEGASWSDVRDSVVLIASVFAGRALIAWAAEVAAVRASSRAKQQLRSAAMEHVLALGPTGPGATDPGGTAALITRGVDALDGYYARYLPQLVLAVIVPIAVLATVLGQDILSAVIIAVTLPLIPLFMALIGMYTKSQVDRQWRTLGVLSGHFLDLVSGLPTLKAFGRAKTQVEAIRAVGDRYRSSTMGVLRVSFLSSLALELLATLSVALVAVSVGLRLAEDQIVYPVALFVLLLAPEAYLPLRLVGQHFHAAAEGLGAADRVFTILETPAPTGGDEVLPRGGVTIEAIDLSARYPGRDELALSRVTFTASPGTVTAVVGGSGGGKSTLLSAILGFISADSGSLNVRVTDTATSLDALDMQQWRQRIAWVPQRAHLPSRDLADTPTVSDAVGIREGSIADERVWEALADAGIADEIRALPGGLNSELAADGSGLSVGQLQRLSLARALITSADVVLLDEPTAALDPVTERSVVAAIGRLAEQGRTVIVVAHRPALLDVATQVIRVEQAAAPEAARSEADDLVVRESQSETATVLRVGW